MPLHAPSWLRVSAAGIVVVVGASALAQPYQSQGIDLLSQIDLATFGNAGGNGNSCWGYVSPSGREYAIMGLNDKVAFVEITNPAAPVIRATVAHSNSQWADIKVYQRYAYVTNETGGGLQVIDMLNIDSGSVTLVGSVTVNGMSTAHTCSLDATSGLVYVCGSSVTGANGGLVAFSLANPASPAFAGMWSTRYIHESQVVTFTSGPYAGRQIAYCSGEIGGVYIIDVTNKAAMTTLSQTTYPGVQYCHQAWLSEDRHYLYVNDELDGPGQGVPSTYTRVLDVSNLSAPVLVNGFTSSAPTSTDHNLYVRGNYIFEANYQSGLRVFDNTNPVAPTEVAWIDTYPESDASGFNGPWSNYPYFPSGNVIVSDINRGLFVVRLNLNYLSFTYPSGVPATVQPNARTPLTVQVGGLGSPLNPATVPLYSRVGNGAFSGTPMTPLGGNQFTANIPAAPCLGTVSFYVSAQNAAGTTFTSPQYAPTTVNTAPALPPQVVTVSYDMETAAGWTGGVAGDTATTGQWERGDPEGTAAQPGDDHTPGAGVNCWVTGRLAGTGVGAFDVDNGFTTLLSPVINLAGAQAATRIGYWRWYSNTGGASPNQDVFRIDISSDGGTLRTPAEAVGPAGPETSGGWFYHDFRVADFVPLTANVRMRFIAEDAAPGSVVEAALDDFSVFRYDCSQACPAITQQPVPQQVSAGANAVFSVTASAPGGVSYQWRKDNIGLTNGGGIAGATSATLTVSGADSADEGAYDVIVTASCGSVLSNAAALTITGLVCDLTQDGATDFTDVFFLIDVVGGLQACTPGLECDLNQDGATDFSDVFLLIDVVGGLTACP